MWGKYGASRVGIDGSSCGESIGAKREGDDGERRKGHEDGGGQRADHSGDSEGCAEDIVGEREAEIASDGVEGVLCAVKKLVKRRHAGARKEDICDGKAGFCASVNADTDGCSGECSGIIDAIADHDDRSGGLVDDAQFVFGR